MWLAIAPFGSWAARIHPASSGTTGGTGRAGAAEVRPAIVEAPLAGTAARVVTTWIVTTATIVAAATAARRDHPPTGSRPDPTGAPRARLPSLSSRTCCPLRSTDHAE